MTNDKKKPWGRVYAVVSNPTHNEQSTTSPKNNYLEVGVAWHNVNRDGRESLRVELSLAPVVWNDPNCRRVIDIQKTEEPRGSK